MSWWLLLNILYGLVSFSLAIYALNSLYLLLLYRKSRGIHEIHKELEKLPFVTVQLPIFNELSTIERLLRAVHSMDYPRELLQVQVLDDSTDETTAHAQEIVNELRSDGLDIVMLHRSDRSGFKAGALKKGLKSAKGEFIAMFDADFVPSPDFLRSTLPVFFDPHVGCVQTRWTHLNRDYSLLTKIQALALDGHFIVEQTARSRNGLLMNFNGSAGIWRTACIEDSGGWQADTLTEDFDLSCRAQFKGWRIDYLPSVTVPAEIPPQMAAYKKQQARWARGSLQTLRKLFWPMMKSSLPIHVKIEGIIHLAHYLVHPLILMLLILTLPMRLNPSPLFQWLPLFTFTALLPPLLFIFAAAPESPGWWQRFKLIPGLVLLGLGISFNNSRAALQGLFSSENGVFVRTPKFGPQKKGQYWTRGPYVLDGDLWIWGEALLSCYALIGILLPGNKPGSWSIPWLMIYSVGFAYVALMSILPLRSIRISKNKP
ncbi:MAG: glycosyltransferase [Anaerolineaceae bacterium]|nr:glycosyltransferase [Anaerolineaceae bacterium]